jgi:hypothetical protein
MWAAMCPKSGDESGDALSIDTWPGGGGDIDCDPHAVVLDETAAFSKMIEVCVPTSALPVWAFRSETGEALVCVAERGDNSKFKCFARDELSRCSSRIGETDARRCSSRIGEADGRDGFVSSVGKPVTLTDDTSRESGFAAVRRCFSGVCGFRGLGDRKLNSSDSLRTRPGPRWHKSLAGDSGASRRLLAQ